VISLRLISFKFGTVLSLCTFLKLLQLTLTCDKRHCWYVCTSTAARAYIYRHLKAETFATVDSKVSLVCIAAGNPPPTVTWTLDDAPLTTTNDDDDDGSMTSRYVIASSVTSDGDVISHVNVSGVRVTDGGTYRCTAKNRVGVESVSGKLLVYGTCANVKYRSTARFSKNKENVGKNKKR